MRNFIKSLLLLFSFVITIFLFQSQVEARDQLLDNGAVEYLINDQAVDRNPGLWEDKGLSQEGGAPLRINGLVRHVKITFRGPSLQQKDYYICGKFDPGDCGETTSSVNVAKFTSQSGKDGPEINIIACGNGEETLKGQGVNPDGSPLSHNDYLNAKEGCDDQKDWFHEGHEYRLHLFDDNGKNLTLLHSARFTVQHSFPLIKLAPDTGSKFSPNTPIKLFLAGRRPGGDSQNNYQVSIEGTNNNVDRTKCKQDGNGIIPPINGGQTVGTNTQWVNLSNPDQPIQEHILKGTGWGPTEWVNSDQDAAIVKLGRGDDDRYGLGLGSFVLKINERVHEGRALISSCNSGYSYMYVYFRFDDSQTGINVFKVQYDPNGADSEDLADLAELPKEKTPPAPCSQGAMQDDNCTAIDTAIGRINTTPQGFINSIFRFILVLAGMGGIIILIYSGYLLMRSQGDKEKIAAARETITSAILGLLFIIFSIVILEIIGIDILRLPGLSR